MSCENELAHDVAVSYLAVGIDRQVPHESFHRWQSLRMDAVLRFFDAQHAASLGIFRQDREGEEA